MLTAGVGMIGEEWGSLGGLRTIRHPLSSGTTRTGRLALFKI